MCINGGFLKRKRIEMGLNRNAVAFKLETSESVVWSMEENKDYKPNVCTANKFAKFFNIEIKEFLTE